MSVSGYVRFGSMAVIAAVGVALLATSVQTQQRGGTVETETVEPVNSGENPYRVIRDWGQLDLEARPWGGSNGVAIDLDGRSLWAVDRCSPGTTPGCADSQANPVHHFDESGNEIMSFGGGDVRLAARYPCRSRRKCVGSRRTGRWQQGKCRRQIQSRRQRPHDAWNTGHAWKPSRSSD